jgi:hypothetical protein
MVSTDKPNGRRIGRAQPCGQLADTRRHNRGLDRIDRGIDRRRIADRPHQRGHSLGLAFGFCEDAFARIQNPAGKPEAIAAR